MKYYIGIILMISMLDLVSQDLDCNKDFECTDSINRPIKSSVNNPFFGDWQLIYNDNYFEYFITDDSIFQYNEGLGLSFALNRQYEIKNDLFIVYDGNLDTINRKFEIINKDRIRIFGEYTIIDYSDTLRMKDDFILSRIKKKEFKYSDVNCWTKRDKRLDCIIKSKDYNKYESAFFNRMTKYKKRNKK